MKDKDRLAYFAARLRKAIKDARFSHIDLAAEMGISKNTIGNWVLGKTYPTIQDVLKLARTLAVEPEDLLGFEKNGISSEVMRKINTLCQKDPQGAALCLQVLQGRRMVADAVEKAKEV